MRKDLISLKPIYSYFLSCNKDVELILKKLFVESRPYSDILKKLLVINDKDCLEDNPDYQKIIDNMSLGDLIEKGYIRLSPKIQRGTHQEIKSYMIISFTDFSPNTVSQHYLDYILSFNIVCYNDAWVLNDYKIRPLIICGYIQGILNSLSENNLSSPSSFQSKIKLTGIGELQFIECKQVVLNEDISMYTLAFGGIHSGEDIKEIGKINS